MTIASAGRWCAAALLLLPAGCSTGGRSTPTDAETLALTRSANGWTPLEAPQGDPRRGEYLASIGACQECHTLRGSDGERLDRSLTFGGGIPFAGPWGVVASANVSLAARDLPRGLLEAAIRGQLAFKFQMPTDLYASMADDDMDDLTAYLKTLTPVHRTNDANTYAPTWRPPPPLAPRPHPRTAPRGRTLERGAYLATIAICRDCHSPRNASGTGYDDAHVLAGGGLALREADGRPLVPPNLTPDVETGLGAWSDADVERALRHGIAKDGHRLNPAMPYEVGLQVLTDDDVGALILYLRSLPPVRRMLPENSHWAPGDPPDACCFAGPVGGYDAREAASP